MGSNSKSLFSDSIYPSCPNHFQLAGPISPPFLSSLPSLLGRAAANFACLSGDPRTKFNELTRPHKKSGASLSDPAMRRRANPHSAQRIGGDSTDQTATRGNESAAAIRPDMTPEAIGGATHSGGGENEICSLQSATGSVRTAYRN